MPDKIISIAEDGTLTVDGVVVTAAEVEKDIPVVEKDLKIGLNTLHNWRQINIKSVEKAVLYVAGVAGATNGFSGLSLPSSLREAIVGGSAFVLAAIHVSTPVKTAV